MSSDMELQEWRQLWRAQPSIPSELFNKVKRQTTYLRHYRNAEIVMTVLFGGGTCLWAFLHPTATWILFASGTVIFMAVAWAFTLYETRTIWAATAPTTAAYLDLSIRHCRWKMRDARYDSVQGVVATAFVLWIAHRILVDLGRTPLSAWLNAALYFFVTSLIVIIFERKRRAVTATCSKKDGPRRIGLQRIWEQRDDQPTSSTGHAPA